MGVGGVVVELPLGKTAEAATFDLEKNVCSHGLFMMAPNFWDPLSRTLQRPLLLDSHEEYGNGSASSSVLVRISQPSDSPHSLRLRVFGVDSLSPRHEQELKDQVRRMLRLSAAEEASVKEFQKMHGEAKERGFGRVFRSPTLFEDMVKCILLCNCQWSRTLSMARALCELQLELQHSSISAPVAKVGNSNTKSTAEIKYYVLKTPPGKESKRKVGAKRDSTILGSRLLNEKLQIEAEDVVRMDSVETSDCLRRSKALCPSISSNGEEFHKCCDSHQCSTGISKVDSIVVCGELSCDIRIGNFPSPRELASLGKKFLEKRCNLGYRAIRILKLAQSIVEGKIQLRELEEACSEPSLSNYSKLADQLNEIYGFGPFTCANVLMCMGFYHVIPTDSETVRHLKQVHAIDSTIRSVQGDVEAVYGKYAPFQFLAYWSEVWQFYEEWFGKLSEMPHSDYKNITAANMRPKGNKSKRIKISQKQPRK
ncbi:uncharacterized protein LOC131326559 isoform X2 [Rhododendron vialii]|uniref:uncharacterized protein LOC131326559 isoform X2 n=1 Tax=Rhododendron vialii TaxID=182163 RepID=UPI00265E3D63|nr:uncharacterized protein LOC131326559 isoform X2 [Rhododendron vialii]